MGEEAFFICDGILGRVPQDVSSGRGTDTDQGPTVLVGEGTGSVSGTGLLCAYAGPEGAGIARTRHRLSENRMLLLDYTGKEARIGYHTLVDQDEGIRRSVERALEHAGERTAPCNEEVCVLVRR